MKHNTTHTATKTANEKVMDTAAVIAAAAKILKEKKTTAAVEESRAAYREKYGADNWKKIRKEISEIRRKEIENAAENARAAVFGYDSILGNTFATLQKNRDWRALCGYARATYKGTDIDTARALVRDWYRATDTTTGAPLVLVSYIDTKSALIYKAYQPAALDGRAALVVLQDSLRNMKNAATKSARKHTDTTAAKIDNRRTAGVITAVFESATGKEYTFTTGAALTGANATTDKAKAAAVKSAAALVGRGVPSSAVLLSEINKECRAAYKKAAAAALVEKESAAAKDAAAAGVRTAQRGKKEPAKDVPSAVAAKRDAVRAVANDMNITTDAAAALMQ